MRCWIELDRNALLHNLKTFQTLCHPSQVVPVIKSNAYGHGLREIYKAIEEQNHPWLAVNYLSEAALLRDMDYKGKIMVVGPLSVDHIAMAKTLDADIFLAEQSLLEAWLSAEPSNRPRAHLKFDTGMSRQGFLPSEVDRLIDTLSHHHAQLVGVCSHFANVEDVLEQTYAHSQMQSFTYVCEKLRTAGFEFLAHIAASSSALIMEESRLSLSRIGISLYGLWPSRTTQLSFLQHYGQNLELRPVLEWKTKVAIKKTVKSGQFIGYGCTYKALRDMKIAVLPVGYFEGYPRLTSNRGFVLIKGQRCPIVGRVCMNMMMVDISHITDLEVGDTVTLIGVDNQEKIEASQIGEWAETIHYEILTKLNPEIPRILR